MISRKYRFHGRNSLRYAYTSGTTVRAPHCSLKFIKNTKRDKYRVAIVVSRKVSKSAVVRNRIRRRLYAIVSELMPVAEAYDLIITVFDDQLAELPDENLHKVVKQLIKEAKIPTRIIETNTPKTTP